MKVVSEKFVGLVDFVSRPQHGAPWFQVTLDDGRVLFGRLPKALLDAVARPEMLKGQRVSFSARLGSRHECVIRITDVRGEQEVRSNGDDAA